MKIGKHDYPLTEIFAAGFIGGALGLVIVLVWLTLAVH